MKNINIAKIDQLKSLAFSIAHETRNPLSAIKGCCENVQDNLNQALEFLKLMETSSLRGLMIIDMILTNVQDEKLDKSNFIDLSISNIINLALKEYAFESDEERNLVNIKDIADNNFIFKGDETMAIVVLFNLLKNALYYQAKIDIWLEKTANHNLLHFKDYGVGIENDKIDQIFDSFFTSDKKGGTGLGLPFCQRIMRAFGGDISCESVKGQYSKFTLKFPFVEYYAS